MAKSLISTEFALVEAVATKNADEVVVVVTKWLRNVRLDEFDDDDCCNCNGGSDCTGCIFNALTGIEISNVTKSNTM